MPFICVTISYISMISTTKKESRCFIRALTWTGASWVLGSNGCSLKARCRRSHQALWEGSWDTCTGSGEYGEWETGEEAGRKQTPHVSKRNRDLLHGVNINSVQQVASQYTWIKARYPRRRVLQDVRLQLLHKHQVVEDDDWVVLAVSD